MAQRGGARPGSGPKVSWRHGKAETSIRVPRSIMSEVKECARLLDQGYTIKSLRLTESLSQQEWLELKESLDYWLMTVETELKSENQPESRISPERREFLLNWSSRWTALKLKISSWLEEDTQQKNPAPSEEEGA